MNRQIALCLAVISMLFISSIASAIGPSDKSVATWAKIKAGGAFNIIQSENTRVDVLLLAKNSDGKIIISSPDGKIYDYGILQKAHDGKIMVKKIIALPSITESIGQHRAGPPNNPIVWKYITDVNPVHDGVCVTLGPDALLIGGNWYWAKLFAEWTISEYERQSGKRWPYYMRSLNSVAIEIMFHCWNCFTPLYGRTFPINIGFNEQFWNWLVN